MELYCFDCDGDFENGHKSTCELYKPENERWRAKWEPIMREFRIPQGHSFIRLRKVPGPKVLTLCRGGNSRSAAAGFLLKYKYCLDTLAAGVEKNSPETMLMLFEWADIVLLTDHTLLPELRVPASFLHKIQMIEVGYDQWGNPLHIELMKFVDQHLSKLFKVPNYLTEVELG